MPNRPVHAARRRGISAAGRSCRVPSRQCRCRQRKPARQSPPQPQPSPMPSHRNRYGTSLRARRPPGSRSRGAHGRPTCPWGPPPPRPLPHPFKPRPPPPLTPLTAQSTPASLSAPLLSSPTVIFSLATHTQPRRGEASRGSEPSSSLFPPRRRPRWWRRERGGGWWWRSATRGT